MKRKTKVIVTIGPASSKQEVLALKKILPKERKFKVISKIETKKAVKNIDPILEVSDAIMVARGDLGLETPMEEVPFNPANVDQKS